MAEVGMEPMREKRKCEECGGDIPFWRKGKTVPKNTRFCGESCQGKARRKKAASLLQKPA
jgi:predicted nucleic acid-binding Zn ribbon protein